MHGALSHAPVRMLPTALDGVDATAAETSRSFAKHFHAQFGIGKLLRGGQRSRSGLGMVEALQGDVITVNPGEVHDGEPVGGSARSWRMLYLDPALVYRAAEELQCRLPAALEFSRPVIQDPRLAAQFDQVFAATTGDAFFGMELAAETALCRLLETMLGCYSAQLAGTLAAGPVARAKARIDDDPSDNIALADLASEAGLTRFQLLRSFARELGLPPHAYLIQRRTVLARQLIASGKSLAEAAVEAGFADQSHMHRAFVRFFGYTPARYAANAAIQ